MVLRVDRDAPFESALLARLPTIIGGDQAEAEPKAITMVPTALMFPAPKAITMARMALMFPVARAALAVNSQLGGRGERANQPLFHQRTTSTALEGLMCRTRR